MTLKLNTETKCTDSVLSNLSSVLSATEDFVKSAFVSTWVTNDQMEKSISVLAITMLTRVVKWSKAITIQELKADIETAIYQLKNIAIHDKDTGTFVCTNPFEVTLTAVGELFRSFVLKRAIAINTSSNHFESDRLSVIKHKVMKSGKAFAESAKESRSLISNYCLRFIQNGSTILTHSLSYVVLHVLKTALASGKNFSVIVAEAGPSSPGNTMSQQLTKFKIKNVVIPDSAVAVAMHQADFVLIGAEAVVESGGILNRIGSFQMGIVAKHLNKPMYVAAESCKFLKIFPLTQNDFPWTQKNEAEDCTTEVEKSSERVKTVRIRDYTPPEYITLLFTDLGILTPSAVSDELIKLYQ